MFLETGEGPYHAQERKRTRRVVTNACTFFLLAWSCGAFAIWALVTSIPYAAPVFACMISAACGMQILCGNIVAYHCGVRYSQRDIIGEWLTDLIE